MQLLASTSTGIAAAVLEVNLQTVIDSIWILVLLALSLPLAFWIIIKLMGRGVLQMEE